VPEALRFLGALLPGGIDAWMAQNHAAAVEAQRALSAALGIAPPCPPAMLGSMASVPLAVAPGAPDAQPAGPFDPLQEALFQRFRIEVPVFPWPGPGTRMLRVSTPAYVTAADVGRLVDALAELGVTRAAG
jgi:isopenicillin-N epimerase